MERAAGPAPSQHVTVRQRSVRRSAAACVGPSGFQHGDLIATTLAVGAALLGRASQTAILLAVQSFTPRAWNLAKIASLAWIFPWRRKVQVPAGITKVAAAFCPAIVALTLLHAVLKRVAPDVARTGSFWNQYLPIHARYAYTKGRYSEKRGYSWPEVEEAWRRRHDWGAPRVTRLLQNMSGYYVKSAQIMASKSDFLPLQWTKEMTPVFFDSMKARPWKVVRRGLHLYLPQTELGQKLQAQGLPPSQLMTALFADLERSSLASASIAQVHLAILSESALEALGPSWQCGPEVVLKVQHPDMQGLMDSDIRNLRRLCVFVKDALPYDPTPLLDEMRDTVGKEFDFVREARLMRAIAGRLENDGLRIRIPQPLTALTSTNLLVMQRMEGLAFSKILEGQDRRLREKAAASVPDLMELYGRMIFRDGLFHADPHAGNLLLQEDGGVALLDFGQVKALPARRHRALAQLIVAMDEGDDFGIALAMSGFGMDFSALGGGVPDVAVIRTVAFIIFDTRPLPEAQIHPLADDAVIKQIPLKQAPEDLFSLGRTVMLLRGLCFSFGLDVHAAKIWRPYAEAALQNAGLLPLSEANQLLDSGAGF